MGKKNRQQRFGQVSTNQNHKCNSYLTWSLGVGVLIEGGGLIEEIGQIR